MKMVEAGQFPPKRKINSAFFPLVTKLSPPYFPHFTNIHSSKCSPYKHLIFRLQPLDYNYKLPITNWVNKAPSFKSINKAQVSFKSIIVMAEEIAPRVKPYLSLSLFNIYI